MIEPATNGEAVEASPPSHEHGEINGSFEHEPPSFSNSQPVNIKSILLIFGILTYTVGATISIVLYAESIRSESRHADAEIVLHLKQVSDDLVWIKQRQDEVIVRLNINDSSINASREDRAVMRQNIEQIQVTQKSQDARCLDLGRGLDLIRGQTLENKIRIEQVIDAITPHKR
jgi:hypothetical protein